MLPFLRNKSVPSGPHEFKADVEIDRPARDVYRLIDLADSLYTRRQLGDKVNAVTGEPDTFTLVVSELPDAVFTVTVTAAEPCRHYAFSCRSAPLFGRVARSHEDYVLEDLGKDGCRLILTNTVEFKGALKNDAYASEAMMLTLASFNAIAKIKLHAEQGVEAVRAYAQAGFDAWGECEAG